MSTESNMKETICYICQEYTELEGLSFDGKYYVIKNGKRFEPTQIKE